MRSIPVGSVDPCRFQTRSFPYDDDGDDPRLRELSVSIRAEGILQPILVRPQGDRFELAAGERRLRAARLAGLEHVPALIRDFDDQQLAEVAAIENLQRVDLPPLEAAASVRLLLDQDGWTHADVAERIGKSVATVARLAKLADLSPARWVNCLDENEILSEIRTGLFMGVVGHVKIHSGRKVLVLDRFTDPSYPHDRS